MLEVIWTRCLTLVFGSTIAAASTSVAAFMLGLGLGAYVIGHRAARVANLFRLYGILELVVGASALVVTLLLSHAASFAGILAWAAPMPMLFGFLRFALVFSLLMAPCAAMGATLPVLTACLQRETPSASFTRTVSVLYAVNTLGAALGAFSTDFLLVPALGVRGSAFLAAAADVLAGLLVILLAPATDRVVGPAPSPRPRRLPGLLLAVLAASGLCGLAYQVLWTRMLVFYNGSDVYAFSTVVSTYLVGLVIGSALVALTSTRAKAPAAAVGALLLLLSLVAASSLLGPSLIAAMRRLLPEGLGFQYVRILSNVVLMLPTTIVLGALFPLTSRLVRAECDDDGSAMGTAYWCNVLGSTAGALLTGFVLLPVLGMQGTLVVVSLLAAGTAALFLFKTQVSRLPSLAGVAVVVALGILLLTLPPSWLRHALFSPKGPILYEAEDSYGTVMLVRENEPDEHVPVENLYVDGFNMMGNGTPARRYASMLAFVPMLLNASDSQDALVICLGLGSSLRACVQSSLVRHVDCVELSSRVVEAVSTLPRVRETLASPKVQVHINDGRNFLALTQNRYDLITAEPPPPMHAGIVNLYSREYYELCRERLKPGGRVCQWLPIYQLSAFETATVIRAFQDVFPHTWLWQGVNLHLCLVGSMEPVDFPFATLDRRIRRDPVFAETGLDDAALFLAAALKDPAYLRAYTATTPPLTDDRPYIEYSVGGFSPDIPSLVMSGTPPEGAPWSADEQRAVAEAARTERLLRAALYARASDPVVDRLVRLEIGRAVLAARPHNGVAALLLGCTGPQEQFHRTKSREGSAEASWELARIAYSRHRFDAAATELELLASREGPLARPAVLARALALLRAGRAKEAGTLITPLISSSPDALRPALSYVRKRLATPDISPLD